MNLYREYIVVGLAVIVSMCMAADAQPSDGGNGQVCTYADHWDQIPEFLQPWVTGYDVDYNVLIDEDVQLVFEGKALVTFKKVNAVCREVPCDEPIGTVTWFYQREIGREYSLGTSMGWSVAAELGIKLLAKIDVEQSFLIEGQFTRTDKETERITVETPVSWCFDKHIDVYKHIAVATGWQEYSSQRYTWYIDDSVGGGTYTTDCGVKRINGDADKVGGWEVDPDWTECENYPECGDIC